MLLLYPVSEAFLSAVQENTRRYYWTGKITTKAGVVHEFSEKEIVKGSGYISAQCCGSTEIELGTVYTAQMGIILFSEIDRYTLEEDVDNIYVQSDNLPVAYASNNVNSTANTARGSLNQTESKALDNGYKFVWEFTPSQGSRSYTKYGEFLDGQDGYWYGFSNEENSSGDATMLWVKISKTDYSIEEGSWTLSNAYLMEVGERATDSSYPERICRCCMRNSYLYVPAYNKKGIYKINVSNPADVTLIEFGFTSGGKPLCESGTCELYLTLIGDLIIGADFQILADDTVIKTKGSQRLNHAATPLFQYKHFLLGWGQLRK